MRGPLVLVGGERLVSTEDLSEAAGVRSHAGNSLSAALGVFVGHEVRLTQLPRAIASYRIQHGIQY